MPSRSKSLTTTGDTPHFLYNGSQVSVHDLQIGQEVEVPSPIPAFHTPAKAKLIRVDGQKLWEFQLSQFGIPFALTYIELYKGRYECGILE